MAAATAGIGAATGIAKFFEGRSMQKKAEQFIENFEWQDLQNPFRNLQVSTVGADFRAEEAARMAATSVDAIRSGGARTIAGNLGRVQAQNNAVNKEIAANLDEQQKRIDYAAAGQDVRNQELVERRQSNELQGYGQMMNVGMGMKYGGLTNIANAAGVFGQTDFSGAGSRPEVSTVTTPNYQGVSPMGGITGQIDIPAYMG